MGNFDKKYYVVMKYVELAFCGAAIVVCLILTYSIYGRVKVTFLLVICLLALAMVLYKNFFKKKS